MEIIDKIKIRICECDAEYREEYLDSKERLLQMYVESYIARVCSIIRA
jgi:hypothetical protein